MVGLFAHYRGIENLTATAGVHDLTDEKYSMVQAFAGGIRPQPVMGREYLVKLSYQKQF